MALRANGVAARSFTGAQAGIRTDDSHGKARIVDIDTAALRASLRRGETPVITGFQGCTADGDISTLGRGGSDTTAVAIAAAMSADECRIYTDVRGIYTTDPRICPAARLLSEITFEEILEMASLGSKVLQIRAVEFAGKYRVPLRVLPAMDASAPGTLIHYKETEMEQPVVTGVAFNRDEAKITFVGAPDRPGIAGQILGAVSSANINVDMIVPKYRQRRTHRFFIHRTPGRIRTGDVRCARRCRRCRCARCRRRFRYRQNFGCRHRNEIARRSRRRHVRGTRARKYQYRNDFHFRN